MADDGTFKGHGGKPGRKSTVISMSAHKSRHNGEDNNKKGPSENSRADQRVEGSGARAFADSPGLGFADQKALPCENTPFERDIDLQTRAPEPPAARGRGRRFLRWGSDESQGNEIFGAPERDLDLELDLELELDSDQELDGSVDRISKRHSGNSGDVGVDVQLKRVIERERERERERAKNSERSGKSSDAVKKGDWDHKTEQSGSVVESFYHAINGLKAGFAGQRNVRVHCVISGMVFILALLLQVDYAGCLALILATGFVLFAEYVNTALEHITDIQAHFRHHQSARLAKDTAAGGVMIAAVTAVLVGATVFVPRLYALLIGQT